MCVIWVVARNFVTSIFIYAVRFSSDSIENLTKVSKEKATWRNIQIRHTSQWKLKWYEICEFRGISYCLANHNQSRDKIFKLSTSGSQGRYSLKVWFELLGCSSSFIKTFAYIPRFITVFFWIIISCNGQFDSEQIRVICATEDYTTRRIDSRFLAIMRFTNR